jgi:hypothetical protein
MAMANTLLRRSRSVIRFAFRLSCPPPPGRHAGGVGRQARLDEAKRSAGWAGVVLPAGPAQRESFDGSGDDSAPRDCACPVLQSRVPIARCCLGVRSGPSLNTPARCCHCRVTIWAKVRSEPMPTFEHWSRVRPSHPPKPPVLGRTLLGRDRGPVGLFPLWWAYARAPPVKSWKRTSGHL